MGGRRTSFLSLLAEELEMNDGLNRTRAISVGVKGGSAGKVVEGEGERPVSAVGRSGGDGGVGGAAAASRVGGKQSGEKGVSFAVDTASSSPLRSSPSESGGGGREGGGHVNAVANMVERRAAAQNKEGEGSPGGATSPWSFAGDDGSGGGERPVSGGSSGSDGSGVSGGGGRVESRDLRKKRLLRQGPSFRLRKESVVQHKERLGIQRLQVFHQQMIAGVSVVSVANVAVPEAEGKEVAGGRAGSSEFHFTRGDGSEGGGEDALIIRMQSADGRTLFIDRWIDPVLDCADLPRVSAVGTRATYALTGIAKIPVREKAGEGRGKAGGAEKEGSEGLEGTEGRARADSQEDFLLELRGTRRDGVAGHGEEQVIIRFQCVGLNERHWVYSGVELVLAAASASSQPPPTVSLDISRLAQ